MSYVKGQTVLLERVFFQTPLLAEITTIKKNENWFNKGNYHPIKILPLISKVFEKIIYSQILATSSSTWIKCFVDSDRIMVFSMYFSDCCKSTYAGTVTTELLNAYDCLPHDLIIENFEA